MTKNISLIIVVFVSVIGCVSDSQPVNSKYKSGNNKASIEIIDEVKDIEVTLTKKSITKTNWIYKKSINTMDDSLNLVAILKSNNSLKLNFPYHGSNYGYILVRKRGNNKMEAIFSIEKGQLMCYDFGNPCELLVRFDNEDPISFTGAGPADHSTTIAFIVEDDKFIKGLSKAKTIKISVIIYGNGAQILEYKTLTPLE